MYHFLTYFLKSSESKRNTRILDGIGNTHNISLFVSPLIMYHLLTYFLKFSESKGIRMTTSPPPSIKNHERVRREENYTDALTLARPE